LSFQDAGRGTGLGGSSVAEGADRGKPRGGKPGGKSRGGKPGDKPRGGKPADKPRGGKPGDKPRGGKPGDKPRGGKPGDKPRGGKPGDKPRGGKPADRPRGDRPGGRTPSGRRPGRPESRVDDRPRDPHIPDDVTAEQLDKGILFELRTLPEGLAELVARHLVVADNCLVEGDIATARAHIAAAKRRAGRVAPVREAAGVAAYLDGDYNEAIAELRTVRRMTGSDEYVPMLADCERGLGRPQRALELIKEVDQRKVDPATRVELTLVAAGARADMGQVDAAIVLLQIPELTKLPKGGPRARLQYAYSDLLERVGRVDEAREWMRKAAASDVDGVTDAAERVEEEGGLIFVEEEFGDEAAAVEP
jgi:hypothetical protein